MRPLFVVPALLLAACGTDGPRPIAIVAVNYAFQAPDSVPRGPAVFTLVNRGTVWHEVQLFRFRHGITADSGLRLMTTADTPDSLYDPSGAVIVAAAGAAPIGGVAADLRPGEVWGMYCAFRDSVGAAEHGELGMFRVLTVTGGGD